MISVPGTSAYERVIGALRGAGYEVQERKNGARSCCPAHNGSNPTSLSINQRTDNKGVVLYCHSQNCSIDDIVAAIKLRKQDLFDEPLLHAAFDQRGEYTYPGGRIVGRKPTPDGKTFWQSGNKQDRSLYRADVITEDTRIVYVVEGEKDVLVANGIGLVAVCSAEGAGKARKYDWTPLSGKEVIIVADNDEPGRKHARQVAAELNKLNPIPASVKIVRAAEGCKDLADHIAADKGIDELVLLTTNDVADIVPLADLADSGEAREEAEAQQVDGDELLQKFEAFIRRFCILPGEHCYPAVALWAAHTYFINRLETSPRLACLSPEPGSGKTRVLEVLDVLCANPLMALDISMAAFFRIVEDRQPAILLDEVDAIFIGKKQSEGAEDMRRVINNGYRVGAVVQRVGGKNRDEVKDFHVFTPVAMAGLGNLPDTLMTRSVILRMKRRRGGETVEQFRDRLHRPEGQELQTLAARWAAAVEALNYPDLPEGVQDRDADVWEPLLMVADLAGGEWPGRARDACVKFIADKPESSVSLGVRLLADLKKIWPADVATMATADILDRLADLDEAPWADLYGEGLRPRKLAQLLGDYDIKSRDVWTPSGTRKGYRRDDLWDAWSRYVPSEKGDVGDVREDGEPVLGATCDVDATVQPPAADLFAAASAESGYLLCPICNSQQLWSVESQERGYCEPCRLTVEPDALQCKTPCCTNKLATPEAIKSGACKPCRDRLFAGYGT